MVFDALNDVGNHDLTLHQVIVSTELGGLVFVFGLAEGRQHHDFDIIGLWSVAQDVEHVKTTDFGHHDIE